MRPNHKNIIVEKFNEKKNVIIMYEVLLRRTKTKNKEQIQEKIKTVKAQLQMLLTKHPEYFI